MYTKNQSSATGFVAVVVAAIGLFFATVVFGQSQDAGKTDAEPSEKITQEAQKDSLNGEHRGHHRRRIKTIDELPYGAQTLTLENGKELFFHEGQLFTYAEARSTYVQIPQALFTPQGRQQMRRRMQQARMSHARKHRAHNRRFRRFHPRT